MASPETPKADQESHNDGVEDAVVIEDAKTDASGPGMVEPGSPVPEESAPEPKAAEPEGIPVEPPVQARAESQPEPSPRGSGGFLGLLLGGVLAAGAGFGLSRVVPEGWPIATGGLGNASAMLATQSSQIEALQAQLAALPVPADTGALTARIDTLEAALAEATVASQNAMAAAASVRSEAAGTEAAAAAEAAASAAAEAATRAEAAASAIAAASPAASGPDLGPRIDALDARIAALEAAPTGTGLQAADPAASAALMAEVARLREDLAGQQAASAQAVEAVKAAASNAEAGVATAQADAQAALAAAQAEAETMRAAAEAESRATLLRAALSRVQAGVESGAPFASAVDELVAGGIAVPEALVAQGEGVPTLARLQEAFPEAAREALSISLKSAADDGLADRLGAFLRTQTGARSLEPREGSDPDAVLSRVEALLKDGQLGPAVAEVGALPQDGQAAMAPWVELAQARLAAQAAVAELAATVGGQ